MQHLVNLGEGTAQGAGKLFGFPGGVLGSSFTEYVLLAPQNPYPIVAYVWSILWPNIDPILVTFGYCSMFPLYFVANYKPHLSHFWVKL